MKKLAIVGSTGSIGQTALNIVRLNRQKFEVVALSANQNHELFLQQILEFKPSIATLENADSFKLIKDKIPKGTELICQNKAAMAAVSRNDVDTVLLASSGMAALPILVEAIKCQKTIALANKESIVCGGKIILDLAKQNNVKIVPVDSEHSAIFQCLNQHDQKFLKRIILTASGGAFFNFDEQQLKEVKLKDALKHPNWSMGKKITIDSATMANKGLEIIEAHYLFDTPIDKIEYIVHPRSIIHSIVEFVDNSCLAQMSHPDMEIAIQYALDYPNRYATSVKALDFARLNRLEFFEPKTQLFPLPELAKNAIKSGAAYAVVFNAANEAAVDLFLNEKIEFLDIARLVQNALSKANYKEPTLQDIYHINDVTKEYIFRDYQKILKATER